MKFHHLRLGIVALASVILLASLMGSSSRAANQGGLTPVSLRMDVFYYGAQVPLLFGIEDGIYKKYGLDVTAHVGRGSGTTIQTVANGSDDFGFADGSTLVKLAAQGVHAKMVVGMVQASPFAILTFPDSGIRKPADLDGKTGGFAPGSATDQLFPAFAKAAGIDLSSIKKLDVDVQTRDSLFLLKKADFDIVNTTAQLPLLENKCSCHLNAMRFGSYGLKLMSNGIVTSDAMIANHPDVVRRFAQATVEAIELSVKDPQRAVDAFMRYAKNAQVKQSVVADQWKETEVLLHSPSAPKAPYGLMDPHDWASTISILEKYSGLAKGAVTPAMVYTNQFLSK